LRSESRKKSKVPQIHAGNERFFAAHIARGFEERSIAAEHYHEIGAPEYLRFIESRWSMHNRRGMFIKEDLFFVFFYFGDKLF